MNLVALREAVLEDLVQGDTAPALARLCTDGVGALRRPVSEARVALVVEVCSVEEALGWAVVLVQLGRVEEASDVVWATLDALLGVGGTPQGAQALAA